MGARPSSFRASVAEVQPQREWSAQQKEIFDWFENPMLPLDEHPHLIVRAKAGTGKTTVIIEGVNRAPEESILLCAFNKRIAEELNTRIDNPRAEAKTLHSLGLQMIRREWRGIPVASNNVRAESLTDLVCKPYEQRKGEKVPFQIKRLVTLLHTKAREMCPLNTSISDVTSLAFRFDYVPDEGWSDYDVEFVTTHALAAVVHAGAEPPTYDIGVDYADMIFLPLVWKLTARDYDLVVVDEAQDMTLAQLKIAQRVCSGRICVVGDDKQCHPAGTLVAMTGAASLPIEQVQAGSEVVSYHDCFRGIRTQGRKVLKTAVREYAGRMLTLKVGKSSVQVTPNHKVPTRLKYDKEAYAIYVMETDGVSRIGCCQLLYGSGFGPTIRARQEGADKLWVLEVYYNRDHARIAETLLSLRFGLPERSGLNSKPDVSSHILDYIGNNVVNTCACLLHFGRVYEYPLYRRNDGKHFGRYIYITEACNLLYRVNEMRTFIGTRDGGEWAPVTYDSQDVKCPVYSLEVEPTEGGLQLYVAGNLLVHNSIYSFRGADSGSLDRLKKDLNALELPLNTTYRCSTEIVKHAQRLVPDIAAGPTNPPGIVDECSYDQLIEQAQAGDFVLSRLNAPLVSITLHLLKKGKRARMAGRDIGKGIVAILKKLRCVDSTPIETVIDRVQQWERKLTSRLAAYGQLDLVDRTRDQAAMILAFAEDAETTGALLRQMDYLFTDDDNETGQILCSSVHKAKGTEADRVFVLIESLYRRGVCEEESHIHYVAITRAKSHLTVVTGVPSLQEKKR